MGQTKVEPGMEGGRDRQVRLSEAGKCGKIPSHNERESQQRMSQGLMQTDTGNGARERKKEEEKPEVAKGTLGAMTEKG